MDELFYRQREGYDEVYSGLIVAGELARARSFVTLERESEKKHTDVVFLRELYFLGLQGYENIFMEAHLINNRFSYEFSNDLSFWRGEFMRGEDLRLRSLLSLLDNGGPALPIADPIIVPVLEEQYIQLMCERQTISMGLGHRYEIDFDGPIFKKLREIGDYQGLLKASLEAIDKFAENLMLPFDGQE